MPTILIALGANLGDRGETLDEAIDELSADPDFTLLQRSSLLTTKPIGGPSGQPDFLNAAAKLATTLSPDQVHQKLIAIEQQHGRVRKQRWGARKLDLDLLLYDQQIIVTPQLSVPHPRMSFRKFVMQPAAEVAAEMTHPELNTTIGELWHQLSKTPPIVEIATLPGPVVHILCERVAEELGHNIVSYPKSSSSYLQQQPSREAMLQELVAQQATLKDSPPEHVVRLIPGWKGTTSVLAPGIIHAATAPAATRLVVFWKRPAASFGPVEASWWNDQQREQCQAELAQAVRNTVHGPRLWLDGNDLETAVTEVAAAIQAILD